MSVSYCVKHFDEITSTELYKILRLRAEVFIIEQDCVYQDIDNKDQKALHIIGKKNNKIIAYTRIFRAGDYFDTASIGRVVVAKDQRMHGYGHSLMKKSIATIISVFKTENIQISAQKYLKKFYENHGFVQEGEEYLEDGIPHIKMLTIR